MAHFTALAPRPVLHVAKQSLHLWAKLGLRVTELLSQLVPGGGQILLSTIETAG